MARIIIADDDKLIHRIYSKIIDYLGHEFISCYNGFEVVKTIKDDTADLIILDNQMPEMNGYEACQAIRKLPNGITVPIIIVSADDSQETILRFLNAGANDYILKPISEPILIAKLKNFLKTASLHKNELAMIREKVVIADQYKIEKVLGYGAHSVVFLALDQKNDNRKVAVKLLNQNILSDELIAVITELTLRLQEAELENVVQIYDFGQYSGSVYIVLEYADGGDLAKQLKQQGRLSEKDIVKIGADITEALISLEKNDILHLDIKPENIMIHEGTYKLSDFGIIYQRTTSTMPLNAEIWGTPAYSSPEILMNGGSESVASDTYSLGVILYEGLIGDNPFVAEKPSVSMFRQLNLHPTSLLEMEGEFSIELSIMIDMMMAKQPSFRPSPQELKSLFAHINDNIAGKSETQLSYLKNLKQVDDEKQHDSPPQKTDEKIEKTVSVFSKATKVPLYIKNKERKSPLSKSSSVLKKFEFKELFIKVSLALFVFIVLYSTTIIIHSLFSKSTVEYDFKGIPSVVICEKCGYKEKKPVIDIRDSRCSKCGGQDWYAVQCSQCEKYFPLNEDKFNDEDLSGEDIDLALEKLYSCPFCKSKESENVDVNLNTN